MKSIKLIIAGSLLLSLAVSVASAQTKIKYTIDGTIKNTAAIPTYVYISDRVTPIDSAKVVNGKYHLDGTISEVGRYNVSGNRLNAGVAQDFVSFYINRGDIKIETNGSFKKSIVTGRGAEINTDFNKMMAHVKYIADSLSALFKTVTDNNDDQGKARVKSEITSLGSTLVNDAVKYLQANPNSPANEQIMGMIIETKMVKPEVTDPLMAKLPIDVQSRIKTKYKNSIDEKKKKDDKEDANAKLATIGSIAIDFTQNDPNDKPITLSSFRGKYVLVDFWASWCSPCRAENPNVLLAYNKYKEKGFTILGVSLDATNQRQAWIDAIAKDGMPWTQVSDLKGFGNKVAELYGIAFIPQNVLIDPNGVIIGKNLRGKDLQDKLESIFK